MKERRENINRERNKIKKVIDLYFKLIEQCGGNKNKRTISCILQEFENCSTRLYENQIKEYKIISDFKSELIEEFPLELNYKSPINIITEELKTYKNISYYKRNKISDIVIDFTFPNTYIYRILLTCHVSNNTVEQNECYFIVIYYLPIDSIDKNKEPRYLTMMTSENSEIICTFDKQIYTNSIRAIVVPYYPYFSKFGGSNKLSTKSSGNNSNFDKIISILKLYGETSEQLKDNLTDQQIKFQQSINEYLKIKNELLKLINETDDEGGGENELLSPGPRTASTSPAAKSKSAGSSNPSSNNPLKTSNNQLQTQSTTNTSQNPSLVLVSSMDGTNNVNNPSSNGTPLNNSSNGNPLSTAINQGGGSNSINNDKNISPSNSNKNLNPNNPSTNSLAENTAGDQLPGMVSLSQQSNNAQQQQQGNYHHHHHHQHHHDKKKQNKKEIIETHIISLLQQRLFYLQCCDYMIEIDQLIKSTSIIYDLSLLNNNLNNDKSSSSSNQQSQRTKGVNNSGEDKNQTLTMNMYDHYSTTIMNELSTTIIDDIYHNHHDELTLSISMISIIQKNLCHFLYEYYHEKIKKLKPITQDRLRLLFKYITGFPTDSLRIIAARTLTKLISLHESTWNSWVSDIYLQYFSSKNTKQMFQITISKNIILKILQEMISYSECESTASQLFSLIEIAMEQKPVEFEFIAWLLLGISGNKLFSTKTNEKIEHIGSQCSGCGMEPISGTRYRCAYCIDYDLCSTCELNSTSIHNDTHSFIYIPYPLPNTQINHLYYSPSTIYSQPVLHSNYRFYKHSKQYHKQSNIHYHIQCSACSMNPIIGYRFKCLYCENFDFCEKCVITQEHYKFHFFIKLNKTVKNKSNEGQNKQNVPQKEQPGDNHAATSEGIHSDLAGDTFPDETPLLTTLLSPSLYPKSLYQYPILKRTRSGVRDLLCKENSKSIQITSLSLGSISKPSTQSKQATSNDANLLSPTSLSKKKKKQPLPILASPHKLRSGSSADTITKASIPSNLTSTPTFPTLSSSGNRSGKKGELTLSNLIAPLNPMNNVRNRSSSHQYESDNKPLTTAYKRNSSTSKRKPSNSSKSSVMHEAITQSATQLSLSQCSEPPRLPTSPTEGSLSPLCRSDASGYPNEKEGFSSSPSTSSSRKRRSGKSSKSKRSSSISTEPTNITRSRSPTVGGDLDRDLFDVGLESLSLSPATKTRSRHSKRHSSSSTSSSSTSGSKKDKSKSSSKPSTFSLDPSQHTIMQNLTSSTPSTFTTSPLSTTSTTGTRSSSTRSSHHQGREIQANITDSGSGSGNYKQLGGGNSGGSQSNNIYAVVTNNTYNDHPIHTLFLLLHKSQNHQYIFVLLLKLIENFAKQSSIQVITKQIFQQVQFKQLLSDLLFSTNSFIQISFLQLIQCLRQPAFYLTPSSRSDIWAETIEQIILDEIVILLNKQINSHAVEFGLEILTLILSPFKNSSNSFPNNQKNKKSSGSTTNANANASATATSVSQIHFNQPPSSANTTQAVFNDPNKPPPINNFPLPLSAKHLSGLIFHPFSFSFFLPFLPSLLYPLSLHSFSPSPFLFLFSHFNQFFFSFNFYFYFL